MSRKKLKKRERDFIVSDDVEESFSEEVDPLSKEMQDEIPDLSRILSANITKSDKKRCIRLLEQMEIVEPFSEDFFRFSDDINRTLSIQYSLSDLEFLEKEEERLSKISLENGNLKIKILKLEAGDQIKKNLLSQYYQMISYPSDSSTHISLREEIEWAIKLPYDKRKTDLYFSMNNTQLNKFYTKIQKELDEELYGMGVVKEKILHVLNDRRSSGDNCGRNIALVGSPGTGKTQICKVISKILKKQLGKISAGSLDISAIKGSNKVWQSSEPSIILQILANLKTNNAIIQIDEVDKLSKTAQYALLHISDPGDNSEFQDNYLKNFPHDLSKILFIYCLNDVNSLDSAFRDRLDIIEVPDYSLEDKVAIFRDYMLPKALVNVGLSKNDLKISRSVITQFLKQKELSLRGIEKIIKEMVGKINMYKNVLLPDGSIGKLKLNYEIPKFSLPLKIDLPLLLKLTSF